MKKWIFLVGICLANSAHAAGDPPSALDDTYCDIAGTTISVAAPGILGNDTDPDTEALSVDLALVTDPKNGTVNVHADGSFDYTPGSGFTGTDKFTYQASDGSLNSNIAEVKINVGAVQTTCQDESNYLSLVANLGFISFTESFEGDGAWGLVRSTVLNQNSAINITSSGITWTANNNSSEVTTAEGPARTGLWGFYATPHGDLTQTDPFAFAHDGFIGSSAETLFGVGGWVQSNTGGGSLALTLDDTINVAFPNPRVENSHTFYGVVKNDGFSKFEFYETEGKLEDQEYIFIDDVVITSSAGPSPVTPLQALAVEFGRADCSMGNPCGGDGDGDGDVDGSDLAGLF